MSDLVVEAWTQALQDLTDDEGKFAFAAVARSVTFGDVEPAHVLQKAEEARGIKPARGKIDSRHLPWISQAPKFFGTKFEAERPGAMCPPTKEFAAWLDEERPKRYRSMDYDGNIFLIQNPEAWEWREVGGAVTYIRPLPEATGEKEKPRQFRASKGSKAA